MAHHPPVPTRFGVLLYPQFELLDTFGPLQCIVQLTEAGFPDTSVSIIARSLDPVSPSPGSGKGSLINASVVPTHTLDNPPELDVLIIPGGLGTLAPGMEPFVVFIEKQYPKLKYLFTVCTGSGLAAQAGILDGRKVTTNKYAWVSDAFGGLNEMRLTVCRHRLPV